MHSYDNRSLTRGFKILECLAEAGEPLAAAEVSRRTGLHRATVHRILTVLVELGYVHKNQHQTLYTTGFYLHTFGYVGNIIARIRYHSARFLKNLSAATGETVHLAALEGTRIVYCDKVERDSRTLPTRIGMRRDAHATALGKVLLASLSPDEVSRRYENQVLARHARRTITNFAQLLQSLTTVGERGYALEDEEYENGMRSVAAAIVNPAGRATCAVSVDAPVHRLTGKALTRTIRQVTNTVGAIADYIVHSDKPAYAAPRAQSGTAVPPANKAGPRSVRSRRAAAV
jgi:IclR family KDG regulon transcriptional repressor